MYDIIIIGMGIGGISAAINAKRSNKNILMLDKGMPGGLLNNIDKISNYPGLIDIPGPDFASILEQQVKSLDIPYKLEEVTKIEDKEDFKEVYTTSGLYQTKNVILALGRKPKYLGLDNEKDLVGKGLSTCAMCDAYFYKDKNIAVVGTGNSALQESVFLANIASHIYLINRRDGFRGDEILVDEVLKNPKIEIIYNANIKTMNEEDKKLKSITLDNDMTLDVEGVFIYIGNKPATEFLDPKILDEEGYVIVNEYFESPIPGIYAIGDCIRKDSYQLVTAASDGVRVIYNMHK